MSLDDAGLVVPEAAITYRRTPEQRADAELSWARPDRAFFAAGACHILAFRYVERWSNANLDVVYLRPTNNDFGHHVYVSDGVRAFDFNGWCQEADLLDVNTKACRADNPTWQGDRLIIKDDQLAFCVSTESARRRHSLAM